MISAVSTSAGAIASQLEDQAEVGELEAANASLGRLAVLSSQLLSSLDDTSVSQLQLLLE